MASLDKGEQRPLTSNNEIDNAQLIRDYVRREESEIGRAFCDNLLQGLPDHLLNFEEYFRGLPTVSENHQESLIVCDGSIQTDQSTQSLLKYGLTPLEIFYAAGSFVEFPLRLMKVGELTRAQEFVIGTPNTQGSSESNLPCLSISQIEAEFCRTAGWSNQIAERVGQWLFEVAEFKPLLFMGARAIVEDQSIRLVLDSNTETVNLKELWSSTGNG